MWLQTSLCSEGLEKSISPYLVKTAQKQSYVFYNLCNTNLESSSCIKAVGCISVLLVKICTPYYFLINLQNTTTNCLHFPQKQFIKYPEQHLKFLPLKTKITAKILPFDNFNSTRNNHNSRNTANLSPLWGIHCQ